MLLSRVRATETAPVCGVQPMGGGQICTVRCGLHHYACEDSPASLRGDFGQPWRQNTLPCRCQLTVANSSSWGL